MKKIFIFILLITGLLANAQGTIPSYPSIKLTKLTEGTKEDSLVVVNADKTLKQLPTSSIKGTTNLDQLATPTGVAVFSSTGNDVVLPLATSTNSGLQSPSDKSKIDGVAIGATANETDAYLLDRTNQTGTQAISTVTGLQAGLDSKVDKVAGERLINASEIIKLGNQSGINTGDQDLSSYATNANLNLKENAANKNIANGYAGLGSDGKLISSQLPSITISDTFVTSSQAAMLALTAETGDVAVRTDLNKSFILKGTNPTVLADWQELLTPTSAVTTVFGRNGAVTAQTGDYTASMVGAPSGSGNSTGTNTGDNATNTQYSGLVSNATHTGDATGSTALTLATVNSNVGTFGSATNTVQTTVNAKGLITAISNVPIQIAESQVTNLVSDLAGKAPTTGSANYIQNQTASAQIADIWVSGNAKFNGVSINAAATTTGVAKNYTQYKNTGGDFYIGQEGSSAGGFFTGSIGYDNIFYGTRPYNFIINGVSQFYLNSTQATFNSNVAAPTFIGNLTGNAATASNSTLWGGEQFTAPTTNVNTYMMAYNESGKWSAYTLSKIQSFLGLGSNAYNSTAYLPLTGGTVSGQITVSNLSTQGFYQARLSDTMGNGVFGGNSFSLRNGSTSEDLNLDVYDRNLGVWTTPVIIKNGGNVVVGTKTSPIGTATPSKISLDYSFLNTTVAKSNMKMYLYPDNGSGSVGFGVGSNYDLIYWAGGTSLGQHRFFTGGFERLTINETGAITATSPVTSPTVYARASNGKTIYLSSSTVDSEVKLDSYDYVNNVPIDVTIGGNGGAIKLRGNTIVTGTVTATAFVTTGGNSTQVVRGDGSLTTGYKVYTVLLNQSGTSAPNATILDNTLSGAVVWSYSSTGSFTGVLAGAFTGSKCFFSINSGDGNLASSFKAYRVDGNTIKVLSQDNGTLTNSLLTATSLEVRVYN